MINKLISVGKIEHDIPGVDAMGGFNEMPTPFFEIDHDEFVHHLRSYTPGYTEYRQVIGIPGERTMCAVTIYWFHDKGLVDMHAPNWRTARPGEAGFGVKYIGQRYFRIGCQHTPDNCVGLGNCYRQYTCGKCGMVWTVDSSD